jgi:hypothetical protein
VEKQFMSIDRDIKSRVDEMVIFNTDDEEDEGKN